MYIKRLFIKYELALQWPWDLSSKYWPGDTSFKFKVPNNALTHYNTRRLLTWEDLKTIQHTAACVEGLITARKHTINCRLYKLLVVHLASLSSETNIFQTRESKQMQLIQYPWYEQVTGWMIHTQVTMVTSDVTPGLPRLC
jgi:hypothetical protein